MDCHPDMGAARRAAISNLFRQRRDPGCRSYLRRVLRDCRALEQPFRGREAARLALGLPACGYTPQGSRQATLFSADSRRVHNHNAARHRAEAAGLALGRR